MKGTKVMTVLCAASLLLSPLQGAYAMAAEEMVEAAETVKVQETENDIAALPEETLEELEKISEATGTDIGMARATENGIVNRTIIMADGTEEEAEELCTGSGRKL